MIEKLNLLAGVFGLAGQVTRFEVISNGNINATYDVTVTNGSENRRFVFQKLNIHVFKNPKQIMKNISKITAHIADKLEAEGKSRDCVMHFVVRENGKNYYTDDGSFWRVSEFVPNTVTYNTCDDLEKLESAGRAFGEFQTMLADFDATQLAETIPGFHDTRRYFDSFEQNVSEDPCGRADSVADVINQARNFKELATQLNKLVDEGKLPFRVTHNDTKINNVLFDKDTGEAKTVIDLDTVMPGLVCHDFGDAIRGGANTAAEDESDLSVIALDMNKFTAFARGFIPPVVNALTDIEIDTLALGAFTIAVELGTRFLNDYLTGDKYFKTLYPGHNVVRARCQYRLAENMLEKMDEMKAVIKDIVERAKDSKI